MKVQDIPVGTVFQMTSKFGTQNIVKIADSKDVTDITELHDRPIAYFTWLDRPDAVTREQFIKGMKEEPGGRTIGGFAIWQHELDGGFTKLEPVSIKKSLYDKAVQLVKRGHSIAYIESQMWAACSHNDSLKDIGRAVKKAMVDLEMTKEDLNFTVQN